MKTTLVYLWDRNGCNGMKEGNSCGNEFMKMVRYEITDVGTVK